MLCPWNHPSGAQMLGEDGLSFAAAVTIVNGGRTDSCCATDQSRVGMTGQRFRAASVGRILFHKRAVGATIPQAIVSTNGGGLGLLATRTKRQKKWVAGKTRTAQFIQSCGARQTVSNAATAFLSLLVQCGWTNVGSKDKGRESTRLGAIGRLRSTASGLPVR